MEHVSGLCKRPAALLLAGMLENDNTSMECLICNLANSRRSFNHDFLGTVADTFYAALHDGEAVSLEDLDDIEPLYPRHQQPSLYQGATELLAKRRHARTSEPPTLGDCALFNENSPYGIACVSLSDGTVRVIANYQDAGLCRHVSAFSVRSPAPGISYDVDRLQYAPFVVMDVYRHIHNDLLAVTAPLTSHCRKQYIIGKSKTCNALFTAPDIHFNPPLLHTHTPLLRRLDEADVLAVATPGDSVVGFYDLALERCVAEADCGLKVDHLAVIKGAIMGVALSSDQVTTVLDQRTYKPAFTCTPNVPVYDVQMSGNILTCLGEGGRIYSIDVRNREVIEHTTQVFVGGAFYNPSAFVGRTENALLFANTKGETLGEIPLRWNPRFSGFRMHPQLPICAAADSNAITLWTLS
ncbi:hypothetical protein GMRT_23244 [Giardia muris]|nr:hypothetical protein GMRT_23244 [Giardia muris]|eukprot:TNJ27650.1 hypothetical protein GMRT_23244 [Giardia muris]